MDKIQLQNLDLDTFIAVDVETTGLDYNKDKIIRNFTSPIYYAIHHVVIF